MGLPISIEALIKQQIVENTRLDYKRDWNPEDIIHSICAFANDIDNWGGADLVAYKPDNSLKSQIKLTCLLALKALSGLVLVFPVF